MYAGGFPLQQDKTTKVKSKGTSSAWQNDKRTGFGMVNPTEKDNHAGYVVAVAVIHPLTQNSLVDAAHCGSFTWWNPTLPKFGTLELKQLFLPGSSSSGVVYVADATVPLLRFS